MIFELSKKTSPLIYITTGMKKIKVLLKIMIFLSCHSVFYFLCFFIIPGHPSGNFRVDWMNKNLANKN